MWDKNLLKDGMMDKKKVPEKKPMPIANLFRNKSKENKDPSKKKYKPPVNISIPGRIPTPWFMKPVVKGVEPAFKAYEGILDTKSGYPWYTWQGLNELSWEDGQRPPREDWEAPIFTKKGIENFVGYDPEEAKKKRDGPIEPPLFTKTGWANMKAKYGTEIELKGPLWSKTGMTDFVGWGEKWSLEDSNFTDAPIYTKGFY